MNIIIERVKQRWTEDRENGFSLLELVIAIGIILVLTVGGLIGYGAVQENAKKAATQAAASEVATAALAFDTDGTNPAEDASAQWNETRAKPQIETDSGAFSTTIGGKTARCVFGRADHVDGYFSYRVVGDEGCDTLSEDGTDEDGSETPGGDENGDGDENTGEDNNGDNGEDGNDGNNGEEPVITECANWIMFFSTAEAPRLENGDEDEGAGAGHGSQACADDLGITEEEIAACSTQWVSDYYPEARELHCREDNTGGDNDGEEEEKGIADTIRIIGTLELDGELANGSHDVELYTEYQFGGKPETYNNVEGSFDFEVIDGSYSGKNGFVSDLKNGGIIMICATVGVREDCVEYRSPEPTSINGSTAVYDFGVVKFNENGFH